MLRCSRLLQANLGGPGLRTTITQDCIGTCDDCSDAECVCNGKKADGTPRHATAVLVCDRGANSAACLGATRPLSRIYNAGVCDLPIPSIDINSTSEAPFRYFVKRVLLYTSLILTTIFLITLFFCGTSKASSICSKSRRWWTRGDKEGRSDSRQRHIRLHIRIRPLLDILGAHRYSHPRCNLAKSLM